MEKEETAMRTSVGVRRFTPDDVQTWMQSEQRQIFLGDVLDATNSVSLGVGFARYAPGESNEWVVTYDEVLIVTNGAFSVTTANGQKSTARAGEVIFLPRDTRLIYSAEEAGAELVYVMYPHWTETQLASDYADLLDTFHPIETVPAGPGDAPGIDNVALMQHIWGPIERGESDDLTPFFDALADDVVFELPLGELHGKQAVIDYFAHASDALEPHPFEIPIEYFDDGDRVVMLSDETFKVKATGATHRARWAWVTHVEDGLITRIVHIQDLSGIAEPLTEILQRIGASPRQR
jgi:ketosteroid isomerase-like protein/quercetin dioxygenase-like cupin family protein